MSNKSTYDTDFGLTLQEYFEKQLMQYPRLALSYFHGRYPKDWADEMYAQWNVTLLSVIKTPGFLVAPLRERAEFLLKFRPIPLSETDPAAGGYKWATEVWEDAVVRLCREAEEDGSIEHIPPSLLDVYLDDSSRALPAAYY